MITQIVPTLPPAVDGLGDYALNLARQLRRDRGLETHFLIGDPHWEGTAKLEGFACTRLKKRHPNTLRSQLGDRALLHYSGYGYAQRGYPSWLAAGLERWHGKRKHLVTLFHEVYTYDCGPPWTSSFWLSPLQKHLATRLVRLSDRALTTRQGYAQLLHALRAGKQKEIPIYPVFSSIGEPAELPALAQRDRRLIIFGHRNTRSLAYEQFGSVLQRICQGLEIEAIYDIGKPLPHQSSSLHGVPIVEMGVTPAPQVSQLMLSAIAGFLCFPPPEYLAKSTIFAAYCAHGLIPILASASPVPVDGLEASKHYWPADAKIGKLSLDIGSAIARRANAWYQHHCLSRQATVLANLLRDIEH